MIVIPMRLPTPFLLLSGCLPNPRGAQGFGRAAVLFPFWWGLGVFAWGLRSWSHNGNFERHGRKAALFPVRKAQGDLGFAAGRLVGDSHGAQVEYHSITPKFGLVLDWLFSRRDVRELDLDYREHVFGKMKNIWEILVTFCTDKSKSALPLAMSAEVGLERDPFDIFLDYSWGT